MSEQDNYRFQVNLSGMIQILSDHLYSNPKVYIRELMQNAIDAITARKAQDPGYEEHILVQVTGMGSEATLMIEDNGIGLTEADIHEFLAMIGQSSKRGDGLEPLQDSGFIGRFGIGLLSCFTVSNEIVMITRSAKGGPALEWRGKPDGTYSIRKLDMDLSIGTKVYLRCKPGFELYYEPELLAGWLYDYGALLPYPIRLQDQDQTRTINEWRPTWLAQPGLARNHREEVLQFGSRLLGERFHDFIPLQTSSGRTGGIAYILPQTVNLNAKKTHRVYLRSMLVSDKAQNVLPDWAFFVKCIIWTDELQPTASREDFYENERLEEVRSELGEALRRELVQMADSEPERLRQTIRLHALSMKSLAMEHRDFYRMIYRWLPFESTFGPKELGELLEEGRTLYFTLTLDEYRQITHVAAAQSLLVVNGGYLYDAELLATLPDILPEVATERLIPEDVSLAFTEVTAAERMRFYEQVLHADAVLQRFRCRVELKRFKPTELPALFTLSKESSDMRALEAAEEISPQAISSVLGSLGSKYREAAYSTLYLNLDNPLVGRLFEAGLTSMLKPAVELLYVNSLLMGHYPMNRQELAVLNQGILHFIDMGLAADTAREGTNDGGDTV